MSGPKGALGWGRRAGTEGASGAEPSSWLAPGSPTYSARKGLRVMVAWEVLVAESFWGDSRSGSTDEKQVPPRSPVHTYTAGARRALKGLWFPRRQHAPQPEASSSWLLLASGFTRWLGSFPSPHCFGLRRHT